MFVRDVMLVTYTTYNSLPIKVKIWLKIALINDSIQIRESFYKSEKDIGKLHETKRLVKPTYQLK